MAQRTTIQEVRDILPPDVESIVTDTQIQAAIDMAVCVVDRFALTFCGQETSEACLTQIETLLAAHFLAMANPQLTINAESSDDCCKASVKYGWKYDSGILGTSYGISANTISGGCLQEFDKPPANIFSIGDHGGQAQDYFI